MFIEGVMCAGTFVSDSSSFSPWGSDMTQVLLTLSSRLFPKTVQGKCCLLGKRVCGVGREKQGPILGVGIGGGSTRI
jgi:hypothetical protein